ncbi:MAG: hypothetical protein EOO56_04285 [Hymenobacter sp.]|nr:MAG: hypothetical protein EOO56_04285 [Hymenobacter sp.]
MNYLPALLLLLGWLPAPAQTIVLPSGEYLDTTSARNPACASAGWARYYNVQGKYPRSSSTLTQEAQAFLQRRPAAYAGSGYVTFRFAVDCAGHRQPQVQVLQTDAQYQPMHFRPELVAALYTYFQTLTEWRLGTVQHVPVNYLAYLTFKLQNGKVVAVVP